MVIFYNLGVRLMQLGIYISQIRSNKARLWLEGRKHLFSDLEKQNLEGCKWFHCASLGEFEQARPVIEKLKENDSNTKILITFFSPSGFEIRKNYLHANHVCYLPLDTSKKARKFVSIVKPSHVFFVKYELWYHFVRAIKNSGGKVFLLSASFRPSHRYFKWYGGFFRAMLKALDRIFVQDPRSSELLTSIQIPHTLTGDTRYDRVKEIADEKVPDQAVTDFSQDSFVIIAGSSWSVEEELLSPILHDSDDIKLIIAPHNISEKRLQEIESDFSSLTIRHSHYKPGTSKRVLIIDSIGRLNNLYQYANLTLVGGGFSGALHNILEPAAHNCPVCFGPDTDKFPEAADMIEFGSAMAITNTKDLRAAIKRVRNGKFKSNKEFISQRTGATEKVINLIN